MTYKFTNRAEKALEIANELAIELNHNYIGTEHLLYGLIAEGTGVASQVLEMQNLTPEKVLEEIDTSNWYIKYRADMLIYLGYLYILYIYIQGKEILKKFRLRIRLIKLCNLQIIMKLMELL